MNVSVGLTLTHYPIRTRKRIEISLVYKHETMNIGEYK